MKSKQQQQHQQRIRLKNIVEKFIATARHIPPVALIHTHVASRVHIHSQTLRLVVIQDLQPSVLLLILPFRPLQLSYRTSGRVNRRRDVPPPLIPGITKSANHHRRPLDKNKKKKGKEETRRRSCSALSAPTQEIKNTAAIVSVAEGYSGRDNRRDREKRRWRTMLEERTNVCVNNGDGVKETRKKCQSARGVEW